MKQALRYTVLWGMLILLVGNVQAAGTGTLSFSSFGRSPDLYLVDSTGKNLRKFTTDHINKRAPTWSPDGRFFTYQSNDDGDPDIYIMDVRNKTSRQLTNHPDRDLSPAWSPNGKWIAFAAGNIGKDGMNISVIGVNGRNRRDLTEVGPNAWARSPAWSPDGEWIAYFFKNLPVVDLDLGHGIRAFDLWSGDNVICVISPEGNNDAQRLKATRGLSSSLVWVPETFFPVSPQPQLLPTQWGQLKK